jgi:hypothetical protein
LPLADVVRAIWAACLTSAFAMVIAELRVTGDAPRQHFTAGLAVERVLLCFQFHLSLSFVSSSSFRRRRRLVVTVPTEG